MKTPGFVTLGLIVRAVSILVLANLLCDVRQVSAQQPCKLNPDLTPPDSLQVTAQQVEDGSASLMDFVLAVRDLAVATSRNFSTLEQGAYLGCLTRQEGSPYRSGSTYLVSLTPDGRIFIHAKAMALSGRRLNPAIYGAILTALGVPPTDVAGLASADSAIVARSGFALFRTLMQNPHAPFDATSPVPGLRQGFAGAAGYAAVYVSTNLRIPILLLAGFEVNESHLEEEGIDYGDPAITAEDVVDHESLATFVNEAGALLLSVMKTGDPTTISRARIAFRDPNGPWRHGPVYLYVLERRSNIILIHGAFPDRYELQPLVAQVRDQVTGEFVLPQVIAAAESNPEGGFLEYFFDDPADDSDSADVPKVGFARMFGYVPADGTAESPVDLIVGSGYYGN